MKQKMGLLLCLCLCLAAAVCRLPAAADDGEPDSPSIRTIEYHQAGDLSGPIEREAFGEYDEWGNYIPPAVVADYTGFVIKVSEDVSFDWNELYCLESVVQNSESYSLRFVGLTDGAIGDGAFAQNGRIARVEGLERIKKIGNGAFDGCTLLTYVDVGEVAHVGDDAFQNCALMETLPLAQGAEVGASAFKGCSSLAYIGDGAVVLATEADGAFAGCASLTKVRLAAASKLPPQTFAGCKSLTLVELGDNATLTAQLLSGSPAIESLIMGNSPTLEEGALKDRKALKALSLGAGAKLGARALSGCANLAALTGKLDVLGESALQDCAKLAVVALSDGGASVGASAFYGCTALSEVGGKVAQAGSRAFEGCAKLKTIALVDGARIDSAAFQDCLSLETVTGRLGVVGRSAFSGCVRLRQLTWPAAGSYGVDAFLGCALDFTKSVPTNLSLSNATRQTPYAVFALTQKTQEVKRNATFDATSAYTLQTASGTPYSALRTPPYHWLDSAFMGDSDHSPRVVLAGSFDTSVPGSYPLKLSIPTSVYANEHELSFTLTVSEDEEAVAAPLQEAGLRESSWFLPGEFAATLGFRYTVVEGGAGALTFGTSKKSVCGIAADGTLIPAKAGTCTVSVKDASGTLRQCKVTVVPNRYAKAKPHKGIAGELTTSTKRLQYQGNKLHMELFIVNRTGKAVKNLRGAKLQLWNERTGQLLYERALGTLLKSKLPNKASRVYTANVPQSQINGGKKLDLGHGDIRAKLVFAQ